MRIYNGKPLLNSVNGTKESMERIFPLMKHYGGTAVALCLDENGIPDTAKGRVEIAGRIIREAARYGIPKKDIVIDVLAMTISSDPAGARTTLEALEGVLENDPRPSYQDDAQRVYGMRFAEWEVRFTVADGVLTVEQIRTAPEE